MKIFAAGTILVLLSAAIIDVRTGKIPNALLIVLMWGQIISGIISKLILHTPLYDGEVLWHKLFTVFAVIVFLYPFFMIGKLGAGDIKLIALTAALVDDALKFILLVFSIGAAMAVFLITKEKLSSLKKDNSQRKIVHLSIPILLAYCLAVCA